MSWDNQACRLRTLLQSDKTSYKKCSEDNAGRITYHIRESAKRAAIPEADAPCRNYLGTECASLIDTAIGNPEFEAYNNQKENSIPIVDLSAFLSNDDKQRQKVAKDLTEACHNFGFVYITGHGVPPELLNDAFQWSRKLFDLSHEDKMKAPHPPGPTLHRGYSHPGLEKVYSKQEASSDVVNESQGSSLREIMDFKVCPSGASSLERLYSGE
ncbi:MAG: hypothetical protein Q9187_005574 [Circinaria calcarea]